MWLHGAVPCGGPCDARNAVNGEEEAPNQPTAVNLPRDRTLMGQLWFLGTVSGLRKFWTNWTPGVCGGHCGHGGVGSGRVPFAFIFSTVCPLPITGPLYHSRQRQRRGILAACPRSPYALLGTTIECYDSESSPFYPVRVENDDEAMKPGAREPGQCPGGEDPASQETLVQPPRILASEGHFGL